MNRLCIFSFFAFTLLGSCTTSNTKIKSFPKHIGYRMHERVVVAPITGLHEHDNEHLATWANELITENLLFFKPVRYYDALYLAKQHGVVIPTSIHDTTALHIVQTKLNIDYIVTGSVTGLKNYTENSPGKTLDVGMATLSMYVIDVKNKSIVWQSTAHTTQSPVVYNDRNGNSVLQGSGDAASALQIACRKSIRKLIKTFELVPNRKAGS